jgi:hypothetical protein
VSNGGESAEFEEGCNRLGVNDAFGETLVIPMTCMLVVAVFLCT